MSNVNALLNQRLKKGENSSKMIAMAKQSASGNLTGFTGIFSVTDLNENEKDCLEFILKEYAQEDAKETFHKSDLQALISLTSEVKAINNQAAILHGERIKKAQTILKKYRDGAFTAWLFTAYGNRQTPYNFLQYYEFYEAMPKTLRPQIESMPRQAVYVLASREGELDKKQEIVAGYKGQTKVELLGLIREQFPLDLQDKRRQNVGEGIVQDLNRVLKLLKTTKQRISPSQKNAISLLLNEIRLFTK